MEPEGSLPQSQVPATCPYPESTRISPSPDLPFPEDPSLYYLPIYPWVSQVAPFPQVTEQRHRTKLSPRGYLASGICAAVP